MTITQSLRIAIVVTVALLLGSVVLPLSLHTLSLHQIQNATFAAVRFAAEKDPTQLSSLPVRDWHEDAARMPASVKRMGWAQFEMRVPRESSTVVATVDLRSTIAPLFLGAGGWLRVILGLLVSGTLVFLGLRYLQRLPSEPHSTRRISHELMAGSNHICDDLLHAALLQLPFPAIVFDRYHQVSLWNDVAANEFSNLNWSQGLHLLDVAEKLEWGTTLLERVDDAVASAATQWSQLLVTRKEGVVCVTLG
ncbi:MAG: hypothetical protein COV45_06980 [Deltaproteobacteria bacterium CG11_big_fil_rev_8_21_14_0_20_47_16]|nr:MAG: hypothetical protein COV45_06980 [Deltaproteobacteria bacterium CG11_big_fil_rev_8_21_14_0_20_47_16]